MNEDNVIPLERFRAYHTVGAIAPCPKDASIAVSTDISGQRNLWLLQRSGRWRRLTPFTERRTLTGVWDADGERLLFGSDYQGNERWDLLLWDRRENWYRELLSDPEVTYYISNFPWSPNEQKIVFTANRDEKRRFDIYTYAFSTGKVEKLHNGPIGMGVFAAWHKQSNQIIVQNLVDPDTMELYLLKDGEMEPILTSEHEIYQFGEPYKDGFFLLTNHDRNFRALAHYAFSKGTYELVETHDWGVTDLAVGNKYLLYTVNERGSSRVYARNLQDGTRKDIEGINGVLWEPKSFKSTDRFVGLLNRYYHPTEIFTLDLTDDGRSQKRTELFYGRIPKERLVEPALIRYESFDGENIPAIVWKPKGRANAPVILYPHGGPEAQSRPTYGPIVQYLCHRGIGVVQPNYRGSSGYGKHFQRKIRGEWGGGELKDVKYCVKYLQTQEWVDEDQIGIFGGSYGGFLTLSAITRLPSINWKVAVDFFGPSNLITFIEHAPPFWQAMVKRLVGDPSNEEVRKELKERSPITHIENIDCPLLVVQGAKDIRVKKSESDQIVEQLRERGVPVKYIVFEDEGHGFSKEKNRVKAFNAAVDFILEHMGLE